MLCISFFLLINALVQVDIEKNKDTQSIDPSQASTCWPSSSLDFLTSASFSPRALLMACWYLIQHCISDTIKLNFLFSWDYSYRSPPLLLAASDLSSNPFAWCRWSNGCILMCYVSEYLLTKFYISRSQWPSPLISPSWVKFKDGHVEWMTQDDGLTSGSWFFLMVMMNRWRTRLPSPSFHRAPHCLPCQVEDGRAEGFSPLSGSCTVHPRQASGRTLGQLQYKYFCLQIQTQKQI